MQIPSQLHSNRDEGEPKEEKSQIKKTPVTSDRHWSRVQLNERPWLQLMCCTLVSSCEVVAVRVTGAQDSRRILS